MSCAEFVVFCTSDAGGGGADTKSKKSVFDKSSGRNDSLMSIRVADDVIVSVIFSIGSIYSLSYCQIEDGFYFILSAISFSRLAICSAARIFLRRPVDDRIKSPIFLFFELDFEFKYFLVGRLSVGLAYILPKY